ncbi:MAG: PilN domain-containing protein [Desulforegulaceae bacterium]|nr:PilN domain-containing protein [Desulforegulaceae bacterium]
MIRINLLPYRKARRKENIRRQISVYFLSLILLLLVLFVIDHSKKTQINDLNSKIKASEAELASLKKKAKEVDILKKELDALNSKIEIIDSLKQGRNFGINILKELTKVVVAERMWFNSSNIERNSIHLDGYALDDKTVADFMRNLDSSLYFFNVELKSLVSSSIKNVELRKFIINAQIKENNPKS